MFVDIRWVPGKTLEQLNMEVVKAAFRMNMGNKMRTAKALGIENDQLDQMLKQIDSDDQTQADLMAQHRARKEAARDRLRMGAPSSQSVEWVKGTPKVPRLTAQGETSLEPRSTSGMSNKVPTRSSPKTKDTQKSTTSAKPKQVAKPAKKPAPPEAVETQSMSQSKQTAAPIES